MSRPLVPIKAILALVAGGLILPIAVAVLLTLSIVLAAMADEAGAVVIRYVALGGGVLWLLDLVCLLLALAVHAAAGSNSTDESDS